jgi:hypothetical protein
VTDTLARRCAIAILLAALLATVVGLLAWGPVPLLAEAHHYADERGFLGLDNAWNALANLPLGLAALIGLWAESRGTYPTGLRHSRQGFHAAALLGAAVAVVYHLSPGDWLYLAAQALIASSFLMLSASLLAERVHAGIAGPWVLAAAVVLPALAVAFSGPIGEPGPPDLRPLLLLQITPLLVVPAGALSLPGSLTRTFDWIVLLAVYGAATVLRLADATILEATSLVSGHTLMHLCYAAGAGWLAYCTMARGTATRSAGGEASERRTSLSTSR